MSVFGCPALAVSSQKGTPDAHRLTYILRTGFQSCSAWDAALLECAERAPAFRLPHRSREPASLSNSKRFAQVGYGTATLWYVGLPPSRRKPAQAARRGLGDTAALLHAALAIRPDAPLRLLLGHAGALWTMLRSPLPNPGLPPTPALVWNSPPRRLELQVMNLDWQTGLESKRALRRTSVARAFSLMPSEHSSSG